MTEKLPRAQPGASLITAIRDFYNLFVGSGIVKSKQPETMQERQWMQSQESRGGLRKEEVD